MNVARVMAKLEPGGAQLSMLRVMAELRGRFAALTPRERDVFGLVVTGLRNKQVAVALGTSAITIKRHRAQVMHKMRVTSLAELVKIADHLGLPSPK